MVAGRPSTATKPVEKWFVAKDRDYDGRAPASALLGPEPFGGALHCATDFSHSCPSRMDGSWLFQAGRQTGTDLAMFDIGRQTRPRTKCC
jgi:hypothetical protein